MIMKKLWMIIVILAVIFLGMLGYKNIKIKKSNISMEEIEKIESYMNQIYMWKEVTGEALPCFETIDEANERWIWQVVQKNLEDYELSYEQIQNKTKELFGQNFTKEFPKQGTEYLVYEEENNKYYPIEINLDQQEDVFLLNQINRITKGYEVEIIEYIEDYSQTTKEENHQIVIRNLKGEEIGRVNSQEEKEAKEIAKSNVDKLTKKKLVLKLENETLQVERVYCY